MKLTAGGVLVFEACLALADIGSSGPEFLAGLYVVDTTLIGTSALSAVGVGFKSVTDDSVLLATSKGASAETTATGVDLGDYDKDVAGEDAWVRLGFRIDGTERAQFYVNGQKVSEITANLPATTDLLVPSFVCQSDGTVDTIVHLDWVKAAFRE
jgi:hypothetical protein